MDTPVNSNQTPVMLLVYLAVIGATSIILLVSCFPNFSGESPTPKIPNEGEEQVAGGGNGDEPEGPTFGKPIDKLSVDQGYLVLALLSGIFGSFIRAIHVLTVRIANNSFGEKWTTWYVFQPWLGAAVGVGVYAVFRAGLLSSAISLNPYGVITLGFFAGCFTKQTLDKLKDVATVFFSGEKPAKPSPKGKGVPTLNNVYPSSIPKGTKTLQLVGMHFTVGAKTVLDGKDLVTEFVSDTELAATLPAYRTWPAGKKVAVKVQTFGKDPKETGEKEIEFE